MLELIVELLVGAAMVALGFLLLWLVQGEAAFDVDANTAWAIGFVVVTVFGVSFLATREALQKRRRRRLGF